MRLGKIQRDALIFVILFSLALIPRVYLLGETTIYPDEISWLVRGKEAFYALKQFNLDFFQYAWWNSTSENEAIGWPISFLSAISLIMFGKGQSGVSLNIMSDYVAGRLPNVLLSSAFIPIFYLLSSRFFSKKIAFLAAILLLLDPTHIALSRWIMHDSFLTTCTFISVITFALGVREKSRKYLMISGLFLSLGFLTKPNGLLPVASWFIVLYLSNKEKVSNFIIASLSFLLFTIVLWPSSWTNPIISIFEYLYRQTQLTQIGINYYFFGESSYNPPSWFYLFQIFVKLPTIITIGLLLFLVYFVRNLNRKNLNFISFFAFFLIFLISISLANIKLGARYALPLWPWIYLAVSYLLIKLISRAKFIFRVVILGLVIASSVFSALKYFPEDYLFYNSLVGGSGNAQKYDLVGLCYGTKEAIKYLNSCYPGTKSLAILGCSNVVAPYYFTGKVTTDWRKDDIVIIENSFKQILSNEEAIKYFNQKIPIFIAKQKDVVVSRVYTNNIRSFTSLCNQ